MRIAHDGTFWIVLDPSPGRTEMSSILVETSLRDLELQIKGGMTCGRDAVIYTEGDEAERDARARLDAWQTYQESLRANGDRARRTATEEGRD